jgi:hypothetical protein
MIDYENETGSQVEYQILWLSNGVSEGRVGKGRGYAATDTNYVPVKAILVYYQK